MEGLALGTGKAPRSASAASSIQFRDVAREAGLTFHHFNGATGHKYYPETFGSGVALLDYDGDGWLDIFLVNGCPLDGGVQGDDGRSGVQAFRRSGIQAAKAYGAPITGDQSRPPGPNARTPERLNARMPTLALYHNNHDGTFTDATHAAGLDATFYGMGCAVGDFDNDGDADLYVTAALGPSHLFRNERVETGRAVFTDVTAHAGVGNAGSWGTSCAFLDYDHDGFLDLFVCNYVDYSLDKDIKCMNGGIKVYCGPLVYNAASCRLYHNEHNGTFRDVTRASGIWKQSGKALGVAVWDFDGDGLPEILVANDLTPNYLFHNMGKGKFTEVGTQWGLAYAEDGTARSGMGVDVADYRHDGHPGVFISNFAREPNSFFRYEGRGLFSDQTYASGMGEVSLLALGFGLFFCDYDNDGWPDAFVTNGHTEPDIERFESPVTYAQRPFLFHNERDGTFQEVGGRSGAPFLHASVGRGAAWGDLDNDGDVDIVVNGNNEPVQLLRNEGGNAAAWLEVRLVGRRSNRDGLGARVRVTGGGMVQTDQARSGSSYLSHSDPRLHFGLGPRATVADVEVRWPSGVVDVVRTVKTNQLLTIEEGRGIRPKL